MKTDPEQHPVAEPSVLLTRPFDLVSRITAPRFRVDTIAFADIGLIALLTLFLSQSFLFSPGVSIDLPPIDEAESIVGVRAEAVATVWKGKIVTVYGSYPLDRMDTAMSRLILEISVPDPDLLLLVDRQTPVDGLTRIYESARRAGFDTVQLAARHPESDEPEVFLP